MAQPAAGRRSTLDSPRLRRLAQQRREKSPVAEEGCDLCGAPIPPEHRHLIDLESRQLICCCQACKVLFDRDAAGGGHYRLVPDRRLRVEDFQLSDAAWESLRIPVDMAFFFGNSRAERVMAFYPSPMGATESLLELRSWTDLERENPILGQLEQDVEALLVNRARGTRSHWVVPIDDCYDLVGVIRTRWKGLTGGKDVWQEIERFFERLARRAKVATRAGETKVSSEPASTMAAGGEETAWQRT